MEIRIQSLHFDATDKLIAYAEKKVGKLDRFIDSEAAQVIFKIIKPQSAMNKEVSITVGGLHAQKLCNTFEEAIDQCVDALKGQIEKKKNKTERG